MSWLRSAVHRAVEASGGRSSLLTRTVRTSLGTVVHHAGQAVAGGARLITVRLGNRTYKSVKLTAKRLEDAALSYRGEERLHLLHRWLVALKENQRAAAALREPQPGDDPNHVPALLILEAPTEEEVSLLSEIFGQVLYPLGVYFPLQIIKFNATILHYRMCLLGGKDVHSAILSSIQDLASLFSSYHDEVLAKRDELLEFAQGAISGLKINADIARLDDEIMLLQKQLNAMDALQVSSTSNPNNISQTITEVDKLKILSESLANSSARAEKRIMENRFLSSALFVLHIYFSNLAHILLPMLQREESLIFRVTKTNEVSGIDKELVAEISGLKKQRDQLEEELRKLKKTREERDQFDEASNQIVLHLKTKVVAAFTSVDRIRALFCCNEEGRARTRLPSESDSEMGKFDQDYKADEISGWEFDELEDEPRPGF
ncbi:hypothetical protein PR202_gb19442 [Eleusine coracana subsp. coracana]|uniref:Uncharacterized protein n=1 Tax=Eleusine coracana subsp. coracana TaxID=191504 RepID=A0AAV5F7X9_ELECO|nr:hypothetical protein PR202_gb19442 [Eleusine coracana subsp. coracana]